MKIIARGLRRITQMLCETLRLCVRRKYVLLFICQKKYFTQNSQKYTEFAQHTSAKICAVCVRQIHSAWFCGFRVLFSPHKFGQRLSVLCETMPLPARHSCKFVLISGSKKRRYAPIRGEFSVPSVAFA